ncbi:hypothetical protein [Erythrobacter sp. YJ-T3-07]|uniref:hypothetical protein n=1 Tax=Erythrobacter sp. YJ-T3-07 TaxID=2793063 RepID=UPI001F23030C|nr:hypothetical protein [Erythrobacter sp. YJ-T3-07]
MSAPARAPLSTTPRFLAVGALVACALSACSPAADPAQGPTQRETGADTPPPAPQAASQPAADNCLLLVWQEQETRDERFDLAHDSADGGAISCATGTTASQFDRAFASIRAAAKARDKAAILDQTGLPLLYIDAEGNRKQLTAPEEIDATFSEVFDDDVLALLREVDLDALTVVPDEGAFVKLGSVWLVVDRDGGRPRIVTVNKQALGEAASAVREKAQAGGGTEAPAKSSE